MVIMTRKAMVACNDNLLKTVIYASEGICLLVNLFLSRQCKRRLQIYSFVTLVAYEIHF